MDKPMEGVYKLGTIFQINPERGHMYGAQFIIATEIMGFGVQGYLALTQPYEGLVTIKGHAFVRIQWGDLEVVGKACWISSLREGNNVE